MFPYVQDKVPNHHEWKSQEQPQGSSDLGKERLEGIDQNLFVNFHTSWREGQAKQCVVSGKWFTIEKVLELYKHQYFYYWINFLLLLTWLLIYSVYLHGILQPVSLIYNVDQFRKGFIEEKLI